MKTPRRSLTKEAATGAASESAGIPSFLYGPSPLGVTILRRHIFMRDLSVLAVVLLLATYLSARPSANPQSPQPVGRQSVQPVQSGTQIFRTYAPSIAIIEATDDTSKVLRFGSGVLLPERRALVTNAHVVSGPGRIRARLGSAMYSSPDIEVQYVDSESDLAVLSLSKIPQEAPTVRVRTGPLPSVGERVFAIGNPQGLERTFSEGVISGVRSLKGIGVVLQHTAPISPGSSGGALFSTGGELIGLTVAYLEGGQNLNFAIPATGVAAAVEQAFDVPSDTQSVTAFAARTRKRFPGVYDGFDDEALTARLRNRYPALGAGIPFDKRSGMPAQLYAFAASIEDILGEYNEQAEKIDISANPQGIAELQALNRRRLTRLRLLRPTTDGTGRAAAFLIAGFEETERRFEYYTSLSTPTRSPDVDRRLLRNEAQYSADGFRALAVDLMPYKDAAPELFDWIEESYELSRRLVDQLSTSATPQSAAPPSIVGTWSDAGNTFANRVVRTPDIEIANRSSDGFVIVSSRQTLVEGFNYLLSGNVAMVNGSITGELTVGFYLKLTGGNEACSRKASLDLQPSGSDLLVGTTRFGNLEDSGVRSETFRAVCLGLPSGIRQVQLQRIR
jgi:serine protease Do